MIESSFDAELVPTCVMMRDLANHELHDLYILCDHDLCPPLRLVHVDAHSA